VARVDAKAELDRRQERLGAITKQGNRYLRKMLLVGSTSALRVAGKRTGALAGWIAAL
jgi:transposase